MCIAQSRFGKISESTKIFFLVIVHIILALIMHNIQLLATMHALLTMAAGAWIALTSKDIKRVIPVIAYITGAEVLWCMTQANVFWEFDKYATFGILLIALLKKRKIERAELPVLFFMLLIPSIIITINDLGFTEMSRQAISFNLSGSLVASICILFFYQMKVSLDDDMRVRVWEAVYPILGVLILAAYNTITATEIQFITDSIFVTSSGFGPDQVSAVLGLGALLLIMLTIQEQRSGGQLWSLLLTVALLTQSG